MSGAEVTAASSCSIFFSNFFFDTPRSICEEGNQERGKAVGLIQQVARTPTSCHHQRCEARSSPLDSWGDGSDCLAPVTSCCIHLLVPAGNLQSLFLIALHFFSSRFLADGNATSLPSHSFRHLWPSRPHCRVRRRFANCAPVPPKAAFLSTSHDPLPLTLATPLFTHEW